MNVYLRSEDGRLWGNASSFPWEREAAELFAKQFPPGYLTVMVVSEFLWVAAAPVGPIQRGQTL